MQISNIFINVSKGEVAKSSDLQKAFGKTDVAEIVKEVGIILSSKLLISIPSFLSDPEERRSASRREGKRP